MIKRSDIKYFNGPDNEKYIITRKYERDFEILRKMLYMQIKSQTYFKTEEYELFMHLLKYLVDAYILVKQRKHREYGEFYTAEEIDKNMIGITLPTVKNHQPFLSTYPNLFFDEFHYNLCNYEDTYAMYMPDIMNKMNYLNAILKTYEGMYYTVLNYIEEQEFDEIHSST